MGFPALEYKMNSSPPESRGYDYVSPGLEIVRPDAAFPEMIVGDTQVPQWCWLRRWVEHNWYCDRRNPDVGFVSRDEAAILYNAARLVRGQRCLEIGCWRGWSTVHLALGSGMLDVIDPLIADPPFAESIRRSCETAGVLDAITFHAGFSPAAVDTLGSASGKKWSLIFVDGDHEGEAPRVDAEAAMRNAADTAMVLFHDLASPHVAAGLGVLRDAGWRTMIYQTMQIMGVAWRGNIEPPEHTPDPAVFWTLPSHLAGYHVSNWKRPTIRADGGWWAGMTMTDRRDAAMMRAQAAEDAATIFLLKANEASQEIVRRDAQIADADVRLAAHRTELATLHELAARRDAQIADLGVQQHRALMDLSSKATAWKGEVAALAGFARFMTGRRVLLGLLRRSASERFKAIHAHAAGAQIDHLLPSELLHWLLRRRTLLGLARRSKLAGEAIVIRAMAEPLRNVLARCLDDVRESTRPSASMAAIVSNSLGAVDDVQESTRPGTNMAAVVSNSLRALDDLESRLSVVAGANPTLADHRRSVGWGPKAPPFRP